ncbi:uncharacterized protein LOC144440887 [Glandiceps talaboti]
MGNICGRRRRDPDVVILCDPTLIWTIMRYYQCRHRILDVATGQITIQTHIHDGPLMNPIRGIPVFEAKPPQTEMSRTQLTCEDYNVSHILHHGTRPVYLPILNTTTSRRF